LPEKKLEEVGKVIDSHVAKRTRGKEYWEYLVHLKNQAINEASWVNALDLMKFGISIPDFPKCFEFHTHEALFLLNVSDQFGYFWCIFNFVMINW